MGRYDVLAKRTGPKPVSELSGPSGQSSRRGNPAYRQFSAYVPVDLYRRLKVRLAEEELELSAAVEGALSDWLDRKK